MQQHQLKEYFSFLLFFHFREHEIVLLYICLLLSFLFAVFFLLLLFILDYFSIQSDVKCEKGVKKFSCGRRCEEEFSHSHKHKWICRHNLAQMKINSSFCCYRFVLHDIFREMSVSCCELKIFNEKLTRIAIWKQIEINFVEIAVKITSNENCFSIIIK